MVRLGKRKTGGKAHGANQARKKKQKVKEDHVMKTLTSNLVGYKDYQSASISPDTVSIPFYQLVGVPVQGDSPVSREGDVIYLNHIDLNMRILGTEGTLALTDYYNTVRVIIFIYKHPVGSVNLATPVPAVSGTKGLLDVGTITRYIDAPFSFDAKDNFRIISDQRYTVSGATSSDAGQYNTDHVREFRRKIIFRPPLKQMFNAGGAVLTDYNTNVPLIAIMSDSVAANYPSVLYSTRSHFSR